MSAARRAAIEEREYDPRREERRKATRVALPDDVDARMLDDETRRELRSLSKETAELVARHLVVTGHLIDDEPEQALAHARAARALAGRIGVVRQAVGLAAYAAGEWNEALSELRAARRITGRPEHLAVFADCERALGRPERALAYGDDPEVTSLTQDERVELVIVLAGARRDMGQLDAAVLALQEPARRTTAQRPWAARLWYAYADALLVAGREQEARDWFGRTADVDDEGQTDAADRVLVLDGVVLDDLGEDDEEVGEVMDDAALAAYVAQGFVPVGQAAVSSQAAAPLEAEAHPEVQAAAELGAAETADPAPVAEVPAEDAPQRPEGQRPEGLSKPFSGEVAAAEPAAASRPAAALTPTFAAPQDQDAATQSEQEGDGDELTLFS
ncbi:MAG: Tetratricopeptide [Frankiales bacterium]|nr:Tetratricopeptide [Frankiales bacterium]